MCRMLWGPVLLLGLSLFQSVSPQTNCPAAEALQNVTQPQYKDMEMENTTAVPMADLVQSFLNIIQPNPFPKDLILNIFQVYFQKVQLHEELKNKILSYETGFLVCVAIGLLYVALMPIVGFLLACCRCFDKCGGKMYQKQTNSIDCERTTLYWCLFLTTLIILAGNICMFQSNDTFKASIDQGALGLNTTIKNLHTFLSAVPQQFQHVFNESIETIQDVASNLDNIGPILGAEIQQQFRGTLNLVLDSLGALDQNIRTADRHLLEMRWMLVRLQTTGNALDDELEAVKEEVRVTLTRSDCIRCNILTGELDKLKIDSAVTHSTMDEFQSAMDEAKMEDLKARIMAVEERFGSIPQSVTESTRDFVQLCKRELSNIQARVSESMSKNPILDLTTVLDTLDRVQRDIGQVTPMVERAERIRWGVCFVMCCVVFLVVGCNSLGLVLGPVGLKERDNPMDRSWISDFGGTFLMMGSGFSFLFSWLFMIAVLLLLLVGGHVYSLLCQPWRSGQLLKFMDTPGLIPALGVSHNVNISGIYSNCEKNCSLWSTLHLQEFVDLDDVLNITKYIPEVQQHFDKMDITLPTVTFLSSNVKSQLKKFASKAATYNFASTRQQMEKVIAIDLNSTADQLHDSASVQPDDVEALLTDSAAKIRIIQSNIEQIIFPEIERLNSTIWSLQSTMGNISVAVEEVLRNVETAQAFADTNTSQIIKTESRNFLECQITYFVIYSSWAKLAIIQDVGRCAPVAGALDLAETIICAHMLESLNAFWFSLGWCMVLFIPSIIFSIKLAKYYRKMKYADSYLYDNQIVMNQLVQMFQQ